MLKEDSPGFPWESLIIIRSWENKGCLILGTNCSIKTLWEIQLGKIGQLKIGDKIGNSNVQK
jgi:hypothetical protein